MKFDIMSNAWVFSIVHAYFGLLHIFFIQYYFFALAHKITATHASTNKFGVAFVFATFMSIPVLSTVFMNLNNVMNASNSVVFGTHALSIAAVFLALKKVVHLPRIHGFVFFNMFLTVKEYLFREFLSTSNTFLNTSANVMAALILFKMCFDRFMLIPVMINSLNNKEPENLRYCGRNRIPVTLPDENNENFRVRIFSYNLEDIELIKLKKYAAPVFYAFEVIFDNLFLYRQAKDKMHLLNIHVRAIVSPIMLMVLSNLIFEVDTLVKHLAFISLGLLIGVINFMCLKKQRFYKFITFYNFALTCLIECAILKQIYFEKELFKNNFVKDILMDLVNVLQIALPAIFISVKGARSGLEGILLTSNVLSFSFVLFVSAIISNTFGYLEKLKALNLLVKIGLVFQFLISFSPALFCTFYKQTMVKDVGALCMMFVPFYYVFANWAVRHKINA